MNNDYKKEKNINILLKTAFDLLDEIEDKIVQYRRDFHRYPEFGWTEFRTTSIVAHILKNLGYKLMLGKDILNQEYMYNMPESIVIQKAMNRASEEGAYMNFVREMEGGLTGVVGIIQFSKPGPTLALRFDIDALEQYESEEEIHRPMREGFSSVHKGIMHTCGHDGHTAIGLAVAETIACLKEKDEESDKHLLCGTIKLIFQPAEEGGRGALPIVKKGLLDDVDIFISGHIGLNANKTGLIATGTYDWFASTKMTVLFKGESAHAGAKPEEGKNAMLAAATAILNLHAISRHSGGATRINVGIIKGGTSRNIICDEVEMKIQTRGITTGLDNYMRDRAFKIINSAAEMYEVKSDIVINGISISVDSDKKFANKLTSFIKTISEVTEIKEMMVPGGGEDANYYIDHVQKYGGKATYMLYGSNLEASHHARNFDFDEKTLKIASKVLCTSMINLLSLEN